MKIYTKTGDTGETSLFGAGRVGKDHIRVQAYGATDELNSFLGVARVTLGESDALAELDPVLARIQDRIFVIGSMLATPKDAALYTKIPHLADEDIIFLEVTIDRLSLQMPHLHSFILPGGSRAAAELQVARAVCRRAERAIITLAHETDIDPAVIRYINRLSDALFEMARYANWKLRVDEVTWKGI